MSKSAAFALWPIQNRNTLVRAPTARGRDKPPSSSQGRPRDRACLDTPRARTERPSRLGRSVFRHMLGQVEYCIVDRKAQQRLSTTRTKKKMSALFSVLIPRRKPGRCRGCRSSQVHVSTRGSSTPGDCFGRSTRWACCRQPRRYLRCLASTARRVGAQLRCSPISTPPSF